MQQSTRAQVILEERLWLLTGLLVGVAMWLLTDRAVVAAVVGIVLGVVLVRSDRTRRARGDGWAGRSNPEAQTG